MKAITLLISGYMATLAAPTHADGDGGFTFVCADRTGQRVYAEGSKIASNVDTDSAPISFVYRNTDPSKIVVLWLPPGGGTNVASNSQTYEMPVFKTADNQYVAIDMDPGEVHVYSLYLDQGLLSHTMHRDWNLSTNGPVAISMMSVCKKSEQE